MRSGRRSDGSGVDRDFVLSNSALSTADDRCESERNERRGREKDTSLTRVGKGCILSVSGKSVAGMQGQEGDVRVIVMLGSWERRITASFGYARRPIGRCVRVNGERWGSRLGCTSCASSTTSMTANFIFFLFSNTDRAESPKQLCQDTTTTMGYASLEPHLPSSHTPLLPPGIFLSITDTQASDGNFLLHHFISNYIKADHNVILIGLAGILVHYTMVGRKLVKVEPLIAVCHHSVDLDS